MKTFSGFRSRWTMPLSCAAARPRAIATAYSTARRDRQRAVRADLPQRLAVEQFGDDERRAIVHADVEDGTDVRMVERRGRVRFPLEAREPIRIGHDRRAGSTLIATSRSSRVSCAW